MFHPFVPSGLFCFKFWTCPFPVDGVSDYFLLLPCFIEIPAFNLNSVDLRSAASDLGLHCLLMSLLWDDRRKWVDSEHMIYTVHL